MHLNIYNHIYLYIYQKDKMGDKVFDVELQNSFSAGPDEDGAEWTMKNRNIYNCWQLQ